MIYVVLGMHKSGTTLVARLLHEAGIAMGSFDASLGYSEGQVFERHATQAANRALLRGLQIPSLESVWRRRRRPALDAAGHPTNRDSQAYVRFRALECRLQRPGSAEALRPVVEACERAGGDWGFKDPRTCLTYAAWRRVLPRHRVVAVTRGLGQILERSRSGPRHPLRALRVAHAWTVYNAMLLRQLESCDQPWIALSYEGLMAGDEPMERLAAFVGRPLPDVRKPALHRARGTVEVPAWARALRPVLPMDPVVLQERLRGLVS